jgi:hypothetical protein
VPRPQPEPRIPSATPLASAIAAATHRMPVLDDLARAVLAADAEARASRTASADESTLATGAGTLAAATADALGDAGTSAADPPKPSPADHATRPEEVAGEAAATREPASADATTLAAEEGTLPATHAVGPEDAPRAVPRGD